MRKDNNIVTQKHLKFIKINRFPTFFSGWLKMGWKLGLVGGSSPSEFTLPAPAV